MNSLRRLKEGIIVLALFIPWAITWFLLTVAYEDWKSKHED